MPYSPPTPPQELSDNVTESLETHSPEVLRHISRYAEELAEYREREGRLAEQDDEEEIEEQSEDLPDDVPLKATITIKEINENRYYYWQWREGNQIKSKYKGPVNSNEESRSRRGSRSPGE